MARITVVSNDLDTRMSTVSALERTHDLRAVGWPDHRAGPIGAGEPDLVIVDACLLGPPSGRTLRAALQGAAGGQGGVAVRTQAPGILALVDPGDETLILPCLEAGADDYLLKPTRAGELRGKVDAVLAQRLGLLAPLAYDPIAISDSGRILRDPDLAQEGAPTQLGRYEVSGVLGRGGYGVVYRARDLALGRPVALKVLPRELHDNAEAVSRFFRESTAISRLNHPNIVRFFEVGSYRGRLYYTMELVEGRTLKEIADRQAPLNPRLATFYVGQIARALGAIDSLGLVHRDVKPENCLVTPDGCLKLIDFGLVRMRGTAEITSQDDVLGTPYFMCPEYIRAPGIPDIRYDLYALGVTYFHLLTGEYPFDGKNAAHVMEKHLRVPAPAVADYQPGVPRDVAAVVDALLRKDPELRLQSPAEVLARLARLG